jgi:allophanate hydrolase subunit 1
MSNEEMNKKMEFIVEQQAKFAADIQIAREVQATDAKLLKDAVIGVVDIVGSLTRAQMRTDESVKHLTESQARADERLNIFINVVERYISGNGGSESRA